MPNARVGAMPHTQAPTEHHHVGLKKQTKERRKQKGITMEDLKQQTAVRLAKEQRRRNAVTASRNARGKILSQDPRKGRIVNVGPLETSVSCDNSVGSASLHSNPNHSLNQTHNIAPSFSQGSVDDFPHSSFSFGDRDPTSVPPSRQQQLSIQESPNVQGYANAQNQATHQSQSNYYPGHQSKFVAPNQQHSSKVQGLAAQVGVGGSSNSSKLPHGLTVQELKEMTRARLALEAAEVKETIIKSSNSVESDLLSQPQTQIPTNSNHQPRQRVFSQDSRSDHMSMNRQRLHSTDSFGSIERQRLGSVESFSSAPSTSFGNSGYNRGLLTSSTSYDHLEQPSVSSFSYDAVDNESLSTALGSESFFGSESHATKYSTNSTTYNKNPFSQNKGSPISHASTKVTTNGHNDGWGEALVRASSPSSIPTVAHSSGSFGANDNENPQGFFSLPMVGPGKLSRMVSAGAVLPNSVAESVLDHTDADVFNDFKSTTNLSSPEATPRTSNDRSVPYAFPWSNSKKEKTEDVSEDLAVSRLHSGWNSMLNIEGNDSPDDYTLSTGSGSNSMSFEERDNASPENHYYSSPFQTVPEERVIHNLASRDVNVPEIFHDEHSQDNAVPKISNRMRWKKSRN